MHTFAPLSTRDLFVSHIVHELLYEHSYLKLRSVEVGTLVFFGSDHPVDSLEGSNLDFFDEEGVFFKEAFCLMHLKKEILQKYPGEVVFTWEDNDLLIAAKSKVPVPETPSIPISRDNALIEYLYTHRRAILLTYLKDAYVATEMSGQYCGTAEDFLACRDDLRATIRDIESLDRSTFDVYYLYKNEKHTVYEITNKLL